MLKKKTNYTNLEAYLQTYLTNGVRKKCFAYTLFSTNEFNNTPETSTSRVLSQQTFFVIKFKKTLNVVITHNT